jgi:hypothetical protein
MNFHKFLERNSKLTGIKKCREAIAERMDKQREAAIVCVREKLMQLTDL